VCFFVLSLLSKPMLVTLPFVLLLLDIWPLERIWGERLIPTRNTRYGLVLLEKLPLLAMSAASSVITFQAQQAGDAMVPISVWPLSHRFANAIVAYVGYLKQTFWPIDLAVLYPLSNQISLGKTVLAILVIVGITFAVGTQIRQRPWLAVGWLWFLGTLIPVIGLVQVGAQSMADRYTYVPLIGVFVMIAWSLPSAAFAGTNRDRVAPLAAVAVTLTGLSLVTFVQVQVWKNTTTLCDHALMVTKDNYVALNGLGVAKANLGQIDEAISYYRRALELNPNFALTLANLGSAFLAQGKYEEAIETCEKALRLRPNLAETQEDLGSALIDAGRADESVFHNRKALELRPDLTVARLNLGATLLKKGNYDEAIGHFEYVLRLNPQDEVVRAFLDTAKEKRDAAANPAQPGSLSPSGGAATSNALTIPDNIPKYPAAAVNSTSHCVPCRFCRRSKTG
jgi:Flp pilus assembly protein TadD